MTTHFSGEALQFLRELEGHNDRGWFDDHKPVYLSEVREPMLDLIDRVNESLAGFAPGHVRTPQKAMMRIYRDVRFSKDKSPYKTNVAASWPLAGSEKTGASYFLSVSGHEVLIAGGCYGPSPEQLTAIRDHIVAHHGELRALLADPRLTGMFDPADGNPLVRPPRGYPVDHPAVDLLRRRQWATFATLPASVAETDAFLTLVTERFEALTPLIDFLNVPLATLRLERRR